MVKMTSVGGEGLRLVHRPRHDCRHISNNTTGTAETSQIASFRDVHTTVMSNNISIKTELTDLR